MSLSMEVWKIVIDQGLHEPKIELTYGSLKALIVDLKRLIEEKLYSYGSITITQETIQ